MSAVGARTGEKVDYFTFVHWHSLLASSYFTPTKLQVWWCDRVTCESLNINHWITCLELHLCTRTTWRRSRGIRTKENPVQNPVELQLLSYSGFSLKTLILCFFPFRRETVMLHTEAITSGWVSRKQPQSERRWLIIKRRDKRGLTVRWHHSTLAAPPPSLKSTFRKSNETLVEKHWSTECSAPVWCLPVLLSQCEEHLICAVQLLAILHPGDLRLRHAFYCTAQPHLVPLRHRLIGRMLCEHHTCWSRRSRLDPFTQALQSESFLLSYWKFNTFSSADLCVCVFSTQQCFISNLTHFSELSETASSSLTSSIRTSFRSCLRIYYFIFLQSLPDHWSIIWTFKGFMKIQELKQFNCFYFESLTETNQTSDPIREQPGESLSMRWWHHKAAVITSWKDDVMVHWAKHQ